jgi:hypothetical protein
VTSNICWRMTGEGAPVQLGATQTIRIAPLQAAWPTLLVYWGRTVFAENGYYLEHRTAPNAPAGWTMPVIGVDDEGQPAAVRSPVVVEPPTEPEAPSVEMALSELAADVLQVAEQRISDLAGSQQEQMSRLQRQVQLLTAIQAGTATDADRVELAALSLLAERVHALKMFAWVPDLAPPLWGPAPADLSATLYGWASTAGLTAEALSLLDPNDPPPTAPQWPVFEAA